MKITIVAGSNRQQSSGTKACFYMKRILESKGHHVGLIDLYRQPVPLFSPDEECQGGNVSQLKRQMKDAEAIILCTPEYHGSISGTLKNALDYLGEEHFSGKTVLSVSASGGQVGTGSLLALQAIVRSLHGVNCPEWISVGGVSKRFDGNGDPADPQTKERIHRVTDYFIAMADKLTAHTGATV